MKRFMCLGPWATCAIYKIFFNKLPAINCGASACDALLEIWGTCLYDEYQFCVFIEFLDGNYHCTQPGMYII